MGHRHNRKRTRSRHRRAHSANMSRASSTTPATPVASSCSSPHPYSFAYHPPILHRDPRRLHQHPDAHFAMNAPRIRTNAFTDPTLAYTYPQAYAQQFLIQRKPTAPASPRFLQARRPSSAPTIDAIAAATTERRGRDRRGYFQNGSDNGGNNRKNIAKGERIRTPEDELGDELSLCPGAETVVRFLFDGKVDFIDAPSGL